MFSLDSKGEVCTLSDEEVAELQDLSVNLHSMARVQTSMCWQKARLNWLEGDANSKKIHGIMSSRRRCNAIQMVQVNGIQVEGVQNVRTTVFDHFSAHFKARCSLRPGVEDLNFRRLSYADSGNLTRPFSLEEVKQTIWDCDSLKSLGPDCISFRFIKEFWSELKVDFMRFMFEFHRNGKLSKEINSTFVALIPKENNLNSTQYVKSSVLHGHTP